MGTSVEQIDRAYGHLLPDSIDRTRSALNAFIAIQEKSAAEGMGHDQATNPAAVSRSRNRGAEI